MSPKVRKPPGPRRPSRRAGRGAPQARPDQSRRAARLARPRSRKGPPVVKFRIAEGEIAAAHDVSAVMQSAAEWMYILRNRSRWAGDQDFRAALRGRAVTTLDRLGVDAVALGRIVTADSPQLEVEILGDAI